MPGVLRAGSDAVHFSRAAHQQGGAASRSYAIATSIKPEETDQLRTAVRFPMKLPLTVKTATGTVLATTEDISSSGILFRGANLPRPGSRIEFTIALPAAVMGAAEDVTVHCVGRVVRHIEQGDDSQAAAIIDEYFLKA